MRRATIWILIVSVVVTCLAYVLLEDIGFYAREDTGAALGFPGIIACMILSGNFHAAYPNWFFPPVNFVCDVVILVGLRTIIAKVRKHE